MSGDDPVLASDAERQATVDRIKAAHLEGRITDAELDDRIGGALRARTRGELSALLGDLPQQPARTVVPVPPPNAPAVAEQHSLRKAWAAWAAASAVTFVVWGITALTAGAFVYPWFLWVAGPWGALLLIQTLFGGRRD